MIYEASVVGFARTVLIIIGVLILLKIIGQFLIARRRMDEDRAHKERENQYKREKEKHLKNQGKVTIGKVKKSNTDDDNFTDYEEIKD